MNDAFHGKVAIVTGAGSGIGRELALLLALRGACVVVTDIDVGRAREVVSEIERRSGRGYGAMLDVTQYQSVVELVQHVREVRGPIDLMFNNAGAGFWGELRDASENDWRNVLAPNMWGVIHGIQAVYPLMIQERGGHIVSTASLAGLVPVPGVVPYATAKHAVVGLSLALRVEAARYGVRVSVACPGPAHTQFHQTLHRTAAHVAGPGIPHRAVSAGAIATDILRGVERNDAVIVVPRRARWTWWRYRFRPSSMNRIAKSIVAKLCRTRSPNESHAPVKPAE